MDSVFILMLGVYGFLITSLDDFFVLISLYEKHKGQYLKVVFGTFLGLLVVVVGSVAASSALKVLFEGISKISDVGIGIAMLYVGYGILKGVFSPSDEDDDERVDFHSTLRIIITSGMIYFWNGLDDFVTYFNFLLKYDLYESVLYVTGITVIGLPILAFVAGICGKLFLGLHEKKQNQIKMVAGGGVIIYGIISLYSGIPNLIEILSQFLISSGKCDFYKSHFFLLIFGKILQHKLA